MKKHLIINLALVCALATPVFAMQHNGHDMSGTMEKSSAHSMDGNSAMDHGNSNIIMIGTQTVNGMEGMGHLSAIHDGQSQFMLFVKDLASGSGVAKGTVAVKIKTPDGKVGEAIQLMPMNGYFGADIHLMSKGEYTFMVGTKLEDGVKRTFEYKYHLD